jgi:hypothetical protein
MCFQPTWPHPKWSLTFPRRSATSQAHQPSLTTLFLRCKVKTRQRTQQVRASTQPVRRVYVALSDCKKCVRFQHAGAPRCPIGTCTYDGYMTRQIWGRMHLDCDAFSFHPTHCQKPLTNPRVRCTTGAVGSKRLPWLTAGHTGFTYGNQCHIFFIQHTPP